MRVTALLWFVLGSSLAATACVAENPDAEKQDDSEAAISATTQKLATTGNGISTCGPAHNESCGTKVPVKISDTKTVMLGKYDITAGRFRQFATATKGDFQTYIKGHEPAWWNGQWRAALAEKNPTGLGNVWSDSGAYGYDWTMWLPASTADLGYLVGPWNFGVNGGDMSVSGAKGYSGEESGTLPAVDSSMFGPGNEGCQVADYGARTYFQAKGATGGDDNLYSQGDLDKKALNCASFYVLAAFCAWDGGRLPTTAELDAAWGTEKYPWGDTEPYDADFTGKVTNNGPKDLANYGNADGVVYANPAQKANDDSNHISIPGDFPKGYGPYGNADLAGNLIAITGDITQATASQTDGNNNTTVTVKNAPVVTWHRGGSWQGHQVTPTSTFHFIATNKYIAAGARCAYDTGTAAMTADAFPLGFKATYYSDEAMTKSVGTRVDPYIAFTSASFENPAATKASTPYGVRWQATLTPKYSETYTFTTEAGDGMIVTVNGTKVIDDWTTHGVETKTGTIALTANKPVTIEIDHYNAAGNGVSAKVLWESATQVPQVIPASALTH